MRWWRLGFGDPKTFPDARNLLYIFFAMEAIPHLQLISTSRSKRSIWELQSEPPIFSTKGKIDLCGEVVEVVVIDEFAHRDWSSWRGKKSIYSWIRPQQKIMRRQEEQEHAGNRHSHTRCSYLPRLWSWDPYMRPRRIWCKSTAFEYANVLAFPLALHRKQILSTHKCSIFSIVATIQSSDPRLLLFTRRHDIHTRRKSLMAFIFSDLENVDNSGRSSRSLTHPFPHLSTCSSRIWGKYIHSREAKRIRVDVCRMNMGMKRISEETLPAWSGHGSLSTWTDRARPQWLYVMK